jgi:tetratricopeptide (TPR) repeat protein
MVSRVYKRASWTALACGLSLSMLSLSVPSTAWAGDKEAAEGLFQAGRALMTQERYARACPKFAEAYELEPGVGIQFNLADCYEKLGKLASAWINFHEVVSKVQGSEHQNRLEIARQRLTAIEPRLTKLVIDPQEPAQGLTIRRGNQAVGPAQWRVPIAVDPASYWIDAAAPGKTNWRMQVAVEGEGKLIKVTIPPLSDAVAAAPKLGEPSGAADEPEAPSDGSAQTVAGLVIAGAGLVGVVIGAAFGGVAISKKDEAEPHCPQPNSCYDPGADLLEEAQTAGDISTVALAVGGALLVGGVVVWLTAPSDSSQEAATLTLAPQLGPTQAGLSVRANW